MPESHPCSAVIATRHRPTPLRRTLESILQQEALPHQIIIVDGSDENRHDTLDLCAELCQPFANAGVTLNHQMASKRGAASQRNEGASVARANYPLILFLDDDIILEPDCLGRLFDALASHPDLGAANTTITNQQFERPGRLGRMVGYLVSSTRCRELNWAGRYLGPGFAMLPIDDDSLPAVVPVEWLNTTCTLYRTDALPNPPFPSFFSGGSFAEDFALSQLIRRHWNLANARTARIFHDSQPGDHKHRTHTIAAENAENWLRIMRQVTGETNPTDRAKLAIVLLYRALGNALGPAGPASLIPTLRGYLAGWRTAKKSK